MRKTVLAIAGAITIAVILLVDVQCAIALPLLPMTPEAIQSAIYTARNAWVNGDAHAFADLFAPDGAFMVPGNRWQGPEAIRAVVTEFAATHSTVEIEIRQLLISGDRAMVEWAWADTDAETGERNQAEDAIAVDFRDGKITRWREYIDDKTPHERSS